MKNKQKQFCTVTQDKDDVEFEEDGRNVLFQNNEEDG